MATKNIKTTFFFRTDQGGWSESYIDMTSADIAAASVKALTFARLRLACCGLGVFINGIRVSDQDSSPKKSRLVSNNPSGTGFTEMEATPALTGLSDPVTDSGDQLQTAVLVVCFDSANTRKHLWLGGVPDNLIRDNPTGPAVIAVPTWVIRWGAFRTELQSGGWGFIRRVRGNSLTTPVAITEWLNESGAASRIVAKIAGSNPGFVKGTGKAQVRKATLFNKTYFTPNGTWTVHDVTTAGGFTSVVLRGSEFVDINNIDGAGEIAGIDYQSAAIGSAEIVRQSSHKRGRPFGLYRGRRRTAR